MLLSTLIKFQVLFLLVKADCGDRGELGPKSGVTDADKEKILEVHNNLRNKIAGGGQDGFPTASNMKEMVWDDELAKACQNIVSDCKKSHENPATKSYGSKYGQNLARGWGSGYPEINWEGSITSWYKEVSKYPKTNEYIRGMTGTGHFTQVIWADSDRIGCGFQQFKSSPEYADTTSMPYTNLYCCNYFKRGNLFMIGGTNNLYESGKPCASAGCTCSKKYPNLCANPGK